LLPPAASGSTRAEARRLVSATKRITVNGIVVNIASYAGRSVGDAVAVREKAKKQVRIAEALSLAEQAGYAYAGVSVDAEKMEGYFQVAGQSVTDFAQRRQRIADRRAVLALIVVSSMSYRPL